MTVNRVVSINSNKERELRLIDAINLILSRRTYNTAKTYRNVYKDFFYFTFNKKLEKCTWQDLEKLTYADVLEFISFCEIRSSYNTLKTKIGALQSLSKELNKIKLNCLNSAIFSVKLNQKAIKNNAYGAFTEKEAYDLLDYTKNMDTEKSMVQYLFFKTIIVTAHRLNSLLTLRWKDIKKVREDDIDIWVINIYDKTNYFETPISTELFNELKINLFNGDQNSKVFNISEKSLGNTLHKFCNIYNIDKKGRNLVIHSLKKTSGDIAYKKTNNIVQVARHLKHSNINTAYSYYLDRNSKLSNSISYTMLKDNTIIEDFKKKVYSLDLNVEQFVDLISEVCEVGTIYSILNKIEKK